MRVDVEVEGGDRGFDSGLLVELIAALRACPDGGLLALVSAHPEVRADLERWSRFTGNPIVAELASPTGARFVVRKGAAPREDAPPIGARLWLYTNFDCNLACAYCCVRSSPRAERRALSVDRVEALVRDGTAVGLAEIYLTGGEPFLLSEIDTLASVAAAAAPTTILTNGALFAGKRRDALARMPRDRISLQISLDSPTPARHDLVRGAGTWERAWAGIRTARALGFRVRLAATVNDDDEAAALTAYFDAEGIAAEDRVVRRVALRGLATDGLALARADLVPEVTITAAGVYWHPVGADDDDFLVTREEVTLPEAVALVRAAHERERAHEGALASVFHCA